MLKFWLSTGSLSLQWPPVRLVDRDAKTCKYKFDYLNGFWEISKKPRGGHIPPTLSLLRVTATQWGDSGLFSRSTYSSNPNFLNWRSKLIIKISYGIFSGDEHYDIISAFHKSIRGSDVDATLYWLARMMEGGEEPLYVARRMVRIASEDIG